MRIVPLAWLGTLLAFLVAGSATAAQITGNLFFVANLPPSSLIAPGAHFWSLCVEVQFYLSVALLVALGGKRALMLVPIGCIAITLARFYWNEPMSIVTWFRADEILAGATLALIYEGRFGDRVRRLIARPNIFLLLPLVIASADLRTGNIVYLRPYLCALMIGASLYNAPAWLRALCEWRSVVYVAQTSYALYVFHGIFANSWLGAGDTLVKYAKRPLLFAATFACAHLSTFIMSGDGTISAAASPSAAAMPWSPREKRHRPASEGCAFPPFIQFPICPPRQTSTAMVQFRATSAGSTLPTGRRADRVP